MLPLWLQALSTAMGTHQLVEEYTTWLRVKDGKQGRLLLSMCQLPFLLTVEAKQAILQVRAVSLRRAPPVPSD